MTNAINSNTHIGFADAFKLGFYLLWIFYICFYITICYFSSFLFKEMVWVLFVSSLLNIPFIVIWKKYYSFGLSDIRKAIIKLVTNVVEFAKSLVYLAVLIVCLSIIVMIIWFFGSAGNKIINSLFKDRSWTLMVCGSLMNNRAECEFNRYVIPGFESQKECMLEGAKNFRKEGFECGQGCRTSEYSDIKICDIVCNSSGCSK